MSIHHNHLRIARKSSPLTQADIAFIMQLSDFANISRWEQNERKPRIETHLVYHLLFGIPIEVMIGEQKHETKQSVIQRIKLRIQELRSLSGDSKTASRIAFLESALIKLTT